MARQTALPVPLQIIAGFGALIGVAAGEVPIGLDGGSRGEREGRREREWRRRRGRSFQVGRDLIARMRHLVE